MELVVEYEDGTKAEVRTKPSDLVAFERKFDISYEASQKDPRIEYVFFVAWNGLKRAGETRDFEEWMDAVADIDTPEVPPAPKANRAARRSAS